MVTHDRFQVTTIAGALSDAVVEARDGVIHSWNAGAEQLFGYSAEEVIGKPVAILYPADRQDELEEVLARLRRGEAIENFETVRRRKDGTEVEVSLSISPVRSPSGEIDGAAIVHDISARRHAEEIQGMLAEASRVLAVNLDYHVALSRVASLTLEGLADWCVVGRSKPTARSARSRSLIAIRTEWKSFVRCAAFIQLKPAAPRSSSAFSRPGRLNSYPSSRMRC